MKQRLFAEKQFVNINILYRDLEDV